MGRRNHSYSSYWSPKRESATKPGDGAAAAPAAADLSLQQEKRIAKEAMKNSNEGRGRREGNSFNLMSLVKDRAIASRAEDEITTPPMPTPSARPTQSQPGAYKGAPGKSTRRNTGLRFSLVGRDLGLVDFQNATSNEDGPPLPTEMPDNNNDNKNNNKDCLMEAIPVEESETLCLDALPIDQENLDRKAAREAKYTKWKRFACGFLAIACLLLTMSLAIGLTNKNESNVVVANNETLAPTGSPTRPLPPMQNLELLYDELPEKTKESLYNDESPQYEAWEWLLNHPNLSTLEEWRKKQVFAMVTFFYSFEGPRYWPKAIQSRWLNVTTSECSWVLTDAEVAFFAQQSVAHLGSAYGYQDYQPCNENGEIQHLRLKQVSLLGSAEPSIPPEIALLTSLRIVGITRGYIGAKLSDLLVQELIQLPNLVYLSFSGAGLRGTIPKDIGLLTSVRHFFLPDNKLTGTIPSSIAKMTSLEHFRLGQMKGPNGILPSEIGLLTRITGLTLEASSFTGRIPSELGSLTNMERLLLWGNRLTGSIPSEMGLMSNVQSLYLINNGLDGSVPSQLGLLTNATDIWLGNDLNLEMDSHNSFSGSLPEELWQLSNMDLLFLSNLPYLHGSIPEIKMPSLTVLRVEGSPHLSGTIPEELCFLQEEIAPTFQGHHFQGSALDFDCSDLLCGCNCECGSGNVSTTNPDGWQWNQSLP